jgi:hypothetical protein
MAALVLVVDSHTARDSDPRAVTRPERTERRRASHHAWVSRAQGSRIAPKPVRSWASYA